MNLTLWVDVLSSLRWGHPRNSSVTDARFPPGLSPLSADAEDHLASSSSRAPTPGLCHSENNSVYRHALVTNSTVLFSLSNLAVSSLFYDIINFHAVITSLSTKVWFLFSLSHYHSLWEIQILLTPFYSIRRVNGFYSPYSTFFSVFLHSLPLLYWQLTACSGTQRKARILLTLLTNFVSAT